jgi:ADP-ribosylation factor-like protein 8
VVANKIDLEPHATEPELIRGIVPDPPPFSSLIDSFSSLLELNLDYIVDNPWIIIPCSALRNTNINEVIQWLIRQADAPKK